MSITYKGSEVRITGGERSDRLATIEWSDGRVRVVSLAQLHGTRGAMEVMVAWQAACRRSEELERERAPKELAYAPRAPRRGSTQVDP